MPHTRKLATPEQVEKFKEAARELGCDESEEVFDRALRKIAKREPKKDKRDDPEPTE